MMKINDVKKRRKSQKEVDRLRYEFLPSALEIAETPANPLGKGIIVMISIILFTFILWASFSSVDKVAVAKGSIVPVGRLKVVQSLEHGIVTEIRVEEGSRVEKGEVLVELSSDIKKVDRDSINSQIAVIEFEKELLTMAFEDKLEDYLKTYSSKMRKGVSDKLKRDLVYAFQKKLDAYKANKEVYMSNVDGASIELKREQEELKKLQAELGISKNSESILRDRSLDKKVRELNLNILSEKVRLLREEKEKNKALFDRGIISEREYLDKEAEYNTAVLERELYEKNSKIEVKEKNLKYNVLKGEVYLKRSDISLKEISIQMAENNLKKAQNSLDSFMYQYRSELLDQMIEKDKALEGLRGELKKADKSIDYQTIKAPVSGVVQGLSINTVGGIVKPFETVMTIVPDDSKLIVEAVVENKDIGYINKGDKVNIKVDTFSFQKYGLIEGRVVKISPSAFEDERKGLVYKVKVELEKDTLYVDGKDVKLMPGMTVVSEIKIGKRRVIEFILEPLIKHLDEAFHVK